MQEMTLDGLTRSFGSHWAQQAEWVGVLVELPGQDTPEVIINKAEAFQAKLAYYQGTYNQDLTHKYSPGVKIIGWAFGSNWDEVYEELPMAI
ncbi:hypothetical protein D3C85_777560 [compost metagenome]